MFKVQKARVLLLMCGGVFFLFYFDTQLKFVKLDKIRRRAPVAVRGDKGAFYTHIENVNAAAA